MYTGYYIGSSLLYSIALVLSGFNVSLSRQVALMSWGGEKKKICAKPYSPGLQSFITLCTFSHQTAHCYCVEFCFEREQSKALLHSV